MKDLTPKAELDNVHSTSAPVFATVYNWVNEFKRGRTSTCDALCSGRPIEAATPEIIHKIYDIVLTNRRVKVRELVETTGISHGTVISILHEQLDIKKLSARWMPHEFLCRFITVNETWIHYFTPETKEQSKQWTSPSEPALKKAKTVKSAGKVMAEEKFITREQFIVETEAYFEGLDKSHYSDGLKKLENRWIKYIELKGDYVEK
ncbi:SETMR methyltransferase, partial [Acromyrmex charruanus]